MAESPRDRATLLKSFDETDGTRICSLKESPAELMTRLSYTLLRHLCNCGKKPKRESLRKRAPPGPECRLEYEAPAHTRSAGA